MGKILIIIPCNLYVAPYFSIYRNILDKQNIKYDLLYWDRENISETIPLRGKLIEYNEKITSNDGNKRKIFSFIRFAKFVKKHIEGKKYNKIVFLNTYSGLVALLSNFLKKKFKNRYWIDIRDYTFEKNLIYRLKISKSIKNSFGTSLSSYGFRSFLPHQDYYLLHNIDYQSITQIKTKSEKELIYPIRISFIGNVRYVLENIKLLNVLSNDDRFVLQYFGSGSDKLKEYCENNNINNVKFIGRFDREKTPELYNETDVINNLYGNATTELITALSNKLYFSLGNNIPIIVSPNTLMAQIINETNSGLIIDSYDEKTANKIEEFVKSYYLNIDDKIKNNKMVFDRFEAENRITIKKITEFLTK